MRDVPEHDTTHRRTIAREVLDLTAAAANTLLGFYGLIAVTEFPDLLISLAGATTAAAAVCSLIMIAKSDGSPPAPGLVLASCALHLLVFIIVGTIVGTGVATTFDIRSWNILLAIPFALPAFLTLVHIALERRARYRVWQCPHCMYDLSGINATLCPECGHPITPSTPAATAPPPPPPPQSPDPPPPPS